jgi:NADH-quinone oxidoreductase subunit L
MDNLWLIPTFPLLGFILLTLLPLIFGTVPRKLIGLIGAGSIGLAALTTLLVGQAFLASNQDSYSQVLWQWFATGNLDVSFGLHLDALSLVMLSVITGIGFLIHVYSTGFMFDDTCFGRFMSYMNLFVAAMVMLVLADNLALLFLGWEGVGLCSYLLIGFWYTDPHNGYCARKAFVVTRVGDTAMAIGLFLLFQELGTLHIGEVIQQSQSQWNTGDSTVTLIAFLLLGGAVGKSAQLPLQTWLPDAMAGPTPISALIHAATMVTAGVYLIARTHPLFILAPDALLAVAIVGAATLLVAGFTALTQTDIKRILAYSTVSQIGYMFLALGVGAWSGAIFHLMTHAFFKALLFLGAGTIILSLHHEHNIFKMGGMRKKLPLAFLCFAVGSAALVALPLTSGYYSKHGIMLQAWALPGMGPWLWGAALLGALLTAIYTFRLVFVVFFGPTDQHHTDATEAKGLSMALPLLVLSVLALSGGYWSLHLDSVLPSSPHPEANPIVDTLTNIVPFVGIGIAYLFYGSKKLSVETLMNLPLARHLHNFWHSGWGMDRLYNVILVAPWKFFASINQTDIVDHFYSVLALINRLIHDLLAKTQNGKLRWYASSLAFGAVLLIGMGIWN